MIRFDDTHNVLVMDLVDLEHCGFSYDEFLGELFISGILDGADNPRDPDYDPRSPMAIVVNVAGGHVLIEGTSEEQLAAYRERRAQFEKWLETTGFQEKER